MNHVLLIKVRGSVTTLLLQNSLPSNPQVMASYCLLCALRHCDNLILDKEPA